MTTIVTKKNSLAYAIYVEGQKIAECFEPVATSNELVKNLGVDITEVQVIEMESFPTFIGQGHLVGFIAQEIAKEVITEQTDIDSIINKVNAGIKAPNQNKRSNRNSVVDETSDEKESSYGTEETTDNTTPVGNVEIPGLGNLVYVNGFDGFMRKIAGGIGTVHLVYDEETKQQVKDGDEPGSVLVELEEIPGIYFSWNTVKDEQEKLKEKYGYKPVCSII